MDPIRVQISSELLERRRQAIRRGSRRIQCGPMFLVSDPRGSIRILQARECRHRGRVISGFGLLRQTKRGRAGFLAAISIDIAPETVAHH
jgi:hypothetical protein